MRNFLHRPQPAIGTRAALRAGGGAAVAIALLALTTELSGVPWLMAPFGASCVLLHTLPVNPATMALALGLSITAMSGLRLTHPPAGAVAVVVMLARPGWDFLLFPVLLGSVGLVVAACFAHRVPGGEARYPLRRPQPSRAVEANAGTGLREPV